jgi:hypothetical protein
MANNEPDKQDDDYEEEQHPPIEKLGNEFYERTLAEICKMRAEAHRRWFNERKGISH